MKTRLSSAPADTTELAALWSQGLGAYRAGQAAAAETSFKALLARAPRHGPSWHLLGMIQYGRGEHAAALASLKKAVAVAPELADAHNDLGALLQQMDRVDEAVVRYRKALALDPGRASFHYNLGTALQARKSPDQAIEAYRRALALKPDYAEALNNLANALLDRGQPAEAEHLYRQILARDPGNVGAHYNLGNTLKALGRYREATAAFRQALALDPNHAAALGNLANLLVSLGNPAQAAVLYRQARMANPGNAALHSALLLCLNYDAAIAPEEMLAAHLEWDAAHGQAPRARRFDNRPQPERRLRVGYVSPDFYDHSVAAFFEPLLAAHAPEAVETFCYSDVALADAVTARLRAKADHWRAIADLTDDAVAARIENDRIDILVDLAGHTGRNRLGTFAIKPAPVQLAWCGYPNTTGLVAIDYRITDRYADPEGDSDPRYSEKLVRLPRGFLCYRPPDDAPPVAALPAAAAGYVTFGSFNNIAKIERDVVRAWARILDGVPGSRLLFKTGMLAQIQAVDHFEAWFADAGVDSRRVEFAPRLPTKQDHLAAYGRVDISLDPFPYNGTATTCESLWMGVPVVTLRGTRHAGRVGTSLLNAVDLGELVADSPDTYVAIAADLARDLDRLTTLRATLRERVRTSPLCDAPAFARDMERAYRIMWRDWCAAGAR